MNFASDNAWGAAPEMLAAIEAANSAAVVPYGDDPWTGRLADAFGRLFERPVLAFPVVSGTAANALALATVVPPHGAVFCHADAHIANDECGAPEFFTHGARLVMLRGPGGKIGPECFAAALAHYARGNVHQSQPAALSLTQATECGTCYLALEIAALADVAHRNGMKVHMDGARLANAVAHLGCTPAEATWKAGVDVATFGATKNGALDAECVVFFDPTLARDFVFRRKRAGHLLSKMRFVSAQLLCALEDNRWIVWALAANGLARRVAAGLQDISGAEIAYPVQANAVFVRLPEKQVTRLRENGVTFYEWAAPEKGRTLVRLMTSFATPDEDVERLLAILRG